MHGGDVYRNNVRYDYSVNINPDGVPSEVQWVLTEAALHANKYPDLIHEKLIEETAKIFNIPADQVVYGNGASEIIMAICHGLAPKTVMVTGPGFSGYSRCVTLALPKSKLIYHHLSDENDFKLYQSIIEKIQVEKPSLLFLTNPNNPNGLLIDTELMEEIIEACQQEGTTLVVDECFLPLTGKENERSLAYNIEKYKSLIVLRAFTKTFAIPGVRVGYALCSRKQLADALNSHLPEWNLSIFAQMAAAECLHHLDTISYSAKHIAEERAFLSAGLTKIGVKVFSSDANFILFKCDREDLQERLLEYGILIRDCSDMEGLDKGYYRIAVKNHNENSGLLTAISDALTS